MSSSTIFTVKFRCIEVPFNCGIGNSSATIQIPIRMEISCTTGALTTMVTKKAFALDGLIRGGAVRQLA